MHPLSPSESPKAVAKIRTPSSLLPSLSMATVLRSRSGKDDRSAGGKIVRRCRAPAADRTPYARPKPPPGESAHAPVSSEIPSRWLSGFVLPARMIATGAGKIFSTFFGADSSSSDDDSVAESEDKHEDEDCVSHDDQSIKVVSSSIGKSENKHLIQQLVMQEAFSSEEGEELIKLIKSRVVEDDGRMRNLETTADTRTAAVMEAKKWLVEKKSRSESMLELKDQIYASNQSLLTEGEMTSPVDVAKSYMIARPAWSSPSLKHAESSIAAPIRTQSSKGEMSKSVFPSSLQLSKSSLLIGSWNISEEIRGVHSKATEELLATTPSKKIDLSTSPLEHKLSKEDPKHSNSGDKTHNLISAVSNSDKITPLHLASKNCDGFQESMEGEPERFQSNTLPVNGSSLTSNQDDDGEAVRFVEDADGEAKPADPDANLEQLDGCPLPNETNGSRDSTAENGFPHGASSLSVGDQNNPVPHDKEMSNPINSSQEKVDGIAPVVNMEVQDHPSSANIPSPNENNNNMVSGSQSNSSMQYEELSPYRTRSNTRRGGAAKQRGRGQVNSRRGRERGKITAR